MESLADRAILSMMSAVVGYAIGFLHRDLRQIQKELHMMKPKKAKNESGFMRFPVIADVMVFLVVIIAFWGAIVSNQASRDVEAAQKDIETAQTNIEKAQVRIELVSACNVEYLEKTIEALNQRTTYATEQLSSNIDLQKAQSNYLRDILTTPPLPEDVLVGSLQRYFSLLNEFVEINSDARDKAIANPYPKKEQLQACLSGED